MQHPNVLRFVGVCCEPPNLCIVAEYLNGGSVYDLLHTGARRAAGHGAGPLRLSTSLALQLASDVAEGMAYLHSQSIIHRDLKSANLLLDDNDRVKGACGGAAARLVQKPKSARPDGTPPLRAPSGGLWRGAPPGVNGRHDGGNGDVPLDGARGD